MPHLNTNRPHIRIALSGHEEMLRDHNEAVEFRRTRRSSSVCECTQFFGLFVVVHWRERPGSRPVRLAFFHVIVVDKVCTRSSENNIDYRDGLAEFLLLVEVLLFFVVNNGLNV